MGFLLFLPAYRHSPGGIIVSGPKEKRGIKLVTLKRPQCPPYPPKPPRRRERQRRPGALSAHSAG